MASKEPVRVTASRSKGAKKGKLRHLIITPGANGGHTVEHHFHPPEAKASGKNPMAYVPPPEPEQYPFSTKADTLQHLDSALGGPSVMPAAGGDQAAGGAGTAADDEGDEQAA